MAGVWIQTLWVFNQTRDAAEISWLRQCNDHVFADFVLRIFLRPSTMYLFVQLATSTNNSNDQPVIYKHVLFISAVAAA